MNAIPIYLAFHLVRFGDFARALVGGPIQKLLGQWGEMAQAIVVLALVFALVGFLYRRKIFLRV
jgi:hypothetical protein